MPSEAGEIIAVSAGSFHSLALGADGAVWAWGFGGAGRLGTGTEDDQLTPVEVQMPSEAGEIIAVSAGFAHSLALQSASEPPVAVCAAQPTYGEDYEITTTGILVECDNPAGREVTLDGSASFQPNDSDAELTFQWDVSNISVELVDPTSAVTSGMFPIGVHTATLTVTNENGGFDTCDVTINVQDTTPPEVFITTDKAVLWPPNHTMRDVQVIITASDVCEDPDFSFPITVWASSNEPDNAQGNGDGDTTGDVHGQDGYTAPVDITSEFDWHPDYGEHGAWIATIQLRAERAGSGSGRAYMFEVEALDSNQNVGTSSIVVVVPKSQGQGGGGGNN